MNIYQVVRRGSKWHVLMPDANPAVHSSEDRAQIVAWACEVAQKVDGTVKVRDVGGQIESIYTYVNGAEHHEICAYPSRTAGMQGR